MTPPLAAQADHRAHCQAYITLRPRASVAATSAPGRAAEVSPGMSPAAATTSASVGSSHHIVLCHRRTAALRCSGCQGNASRSRPGTSSCSSDRALSGVAIGASVSSRLFAVPEVPGREAPARSTFTTQRRNARCSNDCSSTMRWNPDTRPLTSTRDSRPRFMRRRSPARRSVKSCSVKSANAMDSRRMRTTNPSSSTSSMPKIAPALTPAAVSALSFMSRLKSIGSRSSRSLFWLMMPNARAITTKPRFEMMPCRISSSVGMRSSSWVVGAAGDATTPGEACAGVALSAAVTVRSMVAIRAASATPRTRITASGLPAAPDSRTSSVTPSRRCSGPWRSFTACTRANGTWRVSRTNKPSRTKSSRSNSS